MRRIDKLTPEARIPVAHVRHGCAGQRAHRNFLPPGRLLECRPAPQVTAQRLDDVAAVPNLLLHVGLQAVTQGVRIERHEPPGRQILRRGCDRRLLDAQALLNRTRGVTQRAHVRRRELPRLAVDGAQRADGMTLRRVQRNARIGPDVRGSGHHGIAGKADIQGRIGHDQGSSISDGMGAKGNRARRLRRIQAHPGLEPLAFLIDERDQYDRHIEGRRRQAGDLIAGLGCRLVEEIQAMQSGESSGLAGIPHIGFFAPR